MEKGIADLENVVKKDPAKSAFNLVRAVVNTHKAIPLLIKFPFFRDQIEEAIRTRNKINYGNLSKKDLRIVYYFDEVLERLYYEYKPTF